MGLIYQKATIDDLAAHLLMLKKDFGIRTTIFMGAGVSASTGIPLANDIAQDIKKRFPHIASKVKEETYGEYMRCLPMGIRKGLIQKYIGDAKLNLAHLFLSSFVREDIIDRILTTNFDPLAIKALALNNIFPSVHDLAESKKFASGDIVDPSIFYIHGRYNGYYVLNTREEINVHSKIVKSLFNDTSRKRCWIIIGYSGDNDPLFKILSEIENYQYGLYWIGYKDNPPSENVIKGILQKESAYYIDGYDADGFFINLANKMNIGKPDILNEPIIFLRDIISSIVQIEKNNKEVGLTDKILNDLSLYINLDNKRKEGQLAKLSQQTRDIWIYENYSEIEKVYTKVLNSKNSEAIEYLILAITNCLEKRDVLDNKEKQESLQHQKERLLKVLANSKSQNVYSREMSLGKEYLSLDDYPAFYKGAIARAGFEEAKRLFNTEKVSLVGKRVFERDRIEGYVYWVFVRTSDFESIAEEFESNKALNVIKHIVKKQNYDMLYNKSHLFLPTTVGDEVFLLNTSRDDSAMLHMQISYKIKEDKSIEPIELLVCKTLGPINISGFVSDSKIHLQSEFSKTVDDVLKESRKAVFIDENKRMFYPFFQFIKMYLNLSYKPQKLLRIPVSSDTLCNYNCVFCCFKPKCEQAIQTIEPIELLDVDILRNIFLGLRNSGCNRVMFTGGEPLLIDIDKLTPLVHCACDIFDIQNVWITTNGSKLSQTILSALKESGLKRLVVSIPATIEKYLKCTCPDDGSNYQLVERNIVTAIDYGFQVRIDLPLSRAGISCYEDVICIIERLEKIGVRDFLFFRLHKSSQNIKSFSSLYIDSDEIMYQFYISDDWRFVESENGVIYFQRNNTKVFVAADIVHSSQACIKNNCGYYCQGTYAAYLLKQNDEVYIRACHREFKDRRNCYGIDKGDLNDVKKISEVFKEVWRYAYEQ